MMTETLDFSTKIPGRGLLKPQFFCLGKKDPLGPTKGPPNRARTSSMYDLIYEPTQVCQNLLDTYKKTITEI